MAIFSASDESSSAAARSSAAGSSDRDPGAEHHAVNGARITPPFPAGLEQAVFGMGCFWGAERKFWQAPGVYSTAVGYAGGYTPNPTYKEVCSGMTGHAEVVLVVFDPKVTSFDEMLRLFWENHDPTQDASGQRRRHAVSLDDLHHDCRTENSLEASRASYQDRLTAAGYGRITTEILDAQPFYYAEDYHQQHACTRIPMVTAGSVVRAWRVRSASRLDADLRPDGDREPVLIRRRVLAVLTDSRAWIVTSVANSPRAVDGSAASFLRSWWRARERCRTSRIRSHISHRWAACAFRSCDTGAPQKRCAWQSR